MIPSLSRRLRLALVLSTSALYAGWHGVHHAAYAKGDDDGGDDDDSGDDDSKGGKGGDDDASGGGGGDDDDAGGGADEDAATQPPVTSGGLYTMNTYPTSELLRPLTMTKGIGQLKLGLGTDLSAKGAFDTFGLSLEGQYGYTDNFTLIGGITDAYNFNQFAFYAGFEGSLIYDVLDIRLAADVHRYAIPTYADFCDPPTTPGEVAGGTPPSMTSAGQETCTNGTQVVDTLPSGSYTAGGTKISLDLGFPFRYAIKPQFAVVALSTLMTIDFNGVSHEYATVLPAPPAMDTTMRAAALLAQTGRASMPAMSSGGHPRIPGPPPPDGVPAMTQSPVYVSYVGNSAKPDLNPSIGVAFNPIPQLSVVAFGQFRVPDFDTAAGAFQVPVTLRVEASPNNKIDFGLEFTLLNVMPPDPQSPIDNRFLNLFVQARFGK